MAKKKSKKNKEKIEVEVKDRKEQATHEEEVNNETEAPETSGENTEAGEKKEENANEELHDPEEIIKMKEQEIGELKNNHIRLMAEFDNYRKRTQKEKATLIRYASEDLMKALLPILDDFERTLEATAKTDNVASVRDGIKLVFNNFFHIMEKNGLDPLETQKGDKFDVEKHEAITSIPVPDDDMKGKVFDVVERGYKLHDKVIRYAKVVVGE